MKIAPKVAFNVATEASYVYILSGQNLIKNSKTFWQPEAYCQTVLPDRLFVIRQKLMENAKIEKCKCDILGDFQTLCKSVEINKVNKKPS